MARSVRVLGPEDAKRTRIFCQVCHGGSHWKQMALNRLDMGGGGRMSTYVCIFLEKKHTESQVLSSITLTQSLHQKDIQATGPERSTKILPMVALDA